MIKSNNRQFQIFCFRHLDHMMSSREFAFCFLKGISLGKKVIVHIVLTLMMESDL